MYHAAPSLWLVYVDFGDRRADRSINFFLSERVLHMHVRCADAEVMSVGGLSFFYLIK